MRIIIDAEGRDSRISDEPPVLPAAPGARVALKNKCRLAAESLIPRLSQIRPGPARPFSRLNPSQQGFCLGGGARQRLVSRLARPTIPVSLCPDFDASTRQASERCGKPPQGSCNSGLSHPHRRIW